MLTEKLRNAAIGRVCAMATSTRDQHYVAQLASHLPGKVVPAFGMCHACVRMGVTSLLRPPDTFGCSPASAWQATTHGLYTQ